MNPDRKTVDDFFRSHGFNIPENPEARLHHQMKGAASERDLGLAKGSLLPKISPPHDRAWCEFLDVLTGISPCEVQNPSAELGSNSRCDSCDGDQHDDDDNWRDGTMRDGIWRARRQQ